MPLGHFTTDLVLFRFRALDSNRNFGLAQSNHGHIMGFGRLIFGHFYGISTQLELVIFEFFGILGLSCFCLNFEFFRTLRMCLYVNGKYGC